MNVISPMVLDWALVAAVVTGLFSSITPLDVLAGSKQTTLVDEPWRALRGVGRGERVAVIVDQNVTGASAVRLDGRMLSVSDEAVSIVVRTEDVERIGIRHIFVTDDVGVEPLEFEPLNRAEYRVRTAPGLRQLACVSTAQMMAKMVTGRQH